MTRPVARHGRMCLLAWPRLASFLALAAMGAGCGHSVPSPHDPTAYVYVRDHRTGICFAVAPPQAYGIEVMTSVPCDSIPPTLEHP